MNIQIIRVDGVGAKEKNMIFIGHILQKPKNCRGAYELKYFLRMGFIKRKILLL